MKNRFLTIILIFICACSALPEPPLLRDDIQFVVVLKELNDTVSGADGEREPMEMELIPINQQLDSQTITDTGEGIAIFRNLHQGVSYRLIMKNPHYNYSAGDSAYVFFSRDLEKIQRDEKLEVFYRYCGELSDKIVVVIPEEINHAIVEEEEFRIYIDNNSECKVWLNVSSKGNLIDEKRDTTVAINRQGSEDYRFFVSSNDRNEARADTLELKYENNGKMLSDAKMIIQQKAGVPEFYTDINEVFNQGIISSDSVSYEVAFKNKGTGMLKLKLELEETESIDDKRKIVFDPDSLQLGPGERDNVDFIFFKNTESEPVVYQIVIKAPDNSYYQRVNVTQGGSNN